MKQFGIIFYLIIFFTSTLFFSPLHAAENIGCCMKTEKVAPNKITTMDVTKAECNLAGEQGPWTVTFDVNKIAQGNRCDPKPESIKEKEEIKPIFFNPSVTIPNSDYSAGQDVKVEESTSALANYIVAILKYSTGVIGIIAAIVLMTGGIIWVTAAGNQEQIGSAKKFIASSLIGMLLTFGSFTILAMVNTNLVNLKITPVKKIQNIPIGDYGCCAKTKTVDGQLEETAEKLSEDNCNNLQGYDKVEFKKDWIPEANKCIDPFGCCKIEANNFQFAFIEGLTVQELCYNKIYEKACKEKETSALRQWSLGTYWQIADMSNQILEGKNIYDIVGDIDTEWQRGRCQEWEVCRNKTVAEPAIPSN